MKRAATPVPWPEIRAEFLDDPRLSLRALATSRDVPYAALCRRAKAERWDAARRVRQAELRIAWCERELDYSRRTTAAAARQLLSLTRTKGTGEASLVKMAGEAWKAHLESSRIWSAASWLVEARRMLDDAKAGRAPRWRGVPHPTGGVHHSHDTDPAERRP